MSSQKYYCSECKSYLCFSSVYSHKKTKKHLSTTTKLTMKQKYVNSMRSTELSLRSDNLTSSRTTLKRILTSTLERLVKTWIQFWHSEGEAILLRDGQRYAGKWQRFGLEWMIDLVDENNNPLPYQFGNTFFQVIPPRYVDLMTME